MPSPTNQPTNWDLNHRCRKEDTAVVTAALEDAKALYQKTYGTAAPKASMDTRHNLPSGRCRAPEPARRSLPSTRPRFRSWAHHPAGSTSDAEALTCMGGVTVSSEDGRITSNNTLDDRLKALVQAELPAIRKAVFGDA